LRYIRGCRRLFYRSRRAVAVDDGKVKELVLMKFMVTDVNDVGRAMNRMRDNDVPIVYGPGRHDISDSIYL
jgi:2,3-dihydroxy-p-cumate/2,3-dihydroxybenzoate 3,4-dioxygenase